MRFIISVSLVLCFISAGSQVVITSHQLNSFNCSPDKLLDLTLQHTGKSPLTVNVVSMLKDSRNVVLLTSKSSTLELLPGNNTIKGANVMADYYYGDSPLAHYIAGQQKLLAGNYELCIAIKTPGGEFPLETCFPLQSAYSSFLQLVSPYDKQVISEKNPMLVWAHSGVLPVMDPNETFELILVEKNSDQDAGQAIVENSMQLYIPKLTSHGLLYPVNAHALLEGGQYAWQVIHKYEDVLIESSEVWWFELEEWEDPRDLKYIEVKNTTSSDVVEVYHSFYFRFDELYNSKDLDIQLFDEKFEAITPQPENDSDASTDTIKKNGFNGYKLNLSSYNLKGGFYTLLIRNAKGDQFRIKIHYNK